MGRCIREPSDNYETKEHDAMSAVTWKNFIHSLPSVQGQHLLRKFNTFPPNYSINGRGKSKRVNSHAFLSGARQETESLNTKIELEQVDGNRNTLIEK